MDHRQGLGRLWETIKRKTKFKLKKKQCKGTSSTESLLYWMSLAAIWYSLAAVFSHNYTISRLTAVQLVVKYFLQGVFRINRFCSYRVFFNYKCDLSISNCFQVSTNSKKGIRVYEYAEVGRHSYYPHHPTVIINQTIWKSSYAV